MFQSCCVVSRICIAYVRFNICKVIVWFKKLEMLTVNITFPKEQAAKSH